MSTFRNFRLTASFAVHFFFLFGSGNATQGSFKSNLHRKLVLSINHGLQECLLSQKSAFQ